MEDSEKDWKLKLRYGKLTTPFKHYTIIAKGKTSGLVDGFKCSSENAFMGMKIWAETFEESADVFQSISEQIGFKISEDLDIYKSDPEEPPRKNPYGYDINFTPIL